jgi:hypothetical protein
MAVDDRPQVAMPLPAHLAALRQDPDVRVRRPSSRTPFRPTLRVTVPVSARVLIGRDEDPEAPDQAE